LIKSQKVNFKNKEEVWGFIQQLNKN